MIYMEKYTGTDLAFAFGKQIAWLIIFYGICKMVWRWAEKRLAVQGG